jgi:hypothetical protein
VRVGRITHVLLAGLLASALLPLACATSFEPASIDEVPFRERAEVQEHGGVRVSAAVPSADEARAIFGTRLYRRGVQPVWIEIQNGLDKELTFLPVGLDPDYFTPIESAFVDLDSLTDRRAIPKSRYFFDRRMGLYVPAGETRHGFVFSTLDEGTKAFNVDIVSGSEPYQFTFFIPVPGLKIDHERVDWEGMLNAEDVVDLKRDALVEALEASPCCTTDKEARAGGDPLNLVVIGDLEDVYFAFMRAGWDETEMVHRGSLWKTIRSFFSGGEYRYSPVSALYVFGRPQDVAFQRARDNIHERNHLRLWLSPMRFEGKPVWIGQISRDVGVRFARRTITTHKIDADVDETREFLVENLAYSQGLEGFAYVRGVGAAPIDEPRANLTGDPYFTDGERVVLWVSARPVAIDDIRYLEWLGPDRLQAGEARLDLK